MNLKAVKTLTTKEREKCHDLETHFTCAVKFCVLPFICILMSTLLAHDLFTVPRPIPVLRGGRSASKSFMSLSAGRQLRQLTYLLRGRFSPPFVVSPTRPSILMGLNKLWDVSKPASCRSCQPGMIELIMIGSCTGGGALYAQPGCH